MAGKKDIVEQALKLIFSGSKAVDEAGVPVRYYHGTTKDLPVIKPGTYFTEDPGEGSAYTFWTDLKNAEKHKGKYSIVSAPELAGKRLEYFGTISDIDSPKVGEFYATDNGIMRYKGNGTWDVASDVGIDSGSLDMSDYTIGIKSYDNSEAAKQMVDEYEEAVKRVYPGGVGGNVIPAYLNVKNPKEMSPLEGNRFGERLGADPKWVADEIERLKAQGYDSIVTTSDDPFYAMEGKKPPKQYVIFDPTQAKSAIGNTGEYDFTNPDITKSSGGSIREGYQTKGRVVGDIVDQALKLIAGGSDDAAKRIASIRRSEPFPADYIEPGSVRYRYEHPDTSSFMEIITRPKGARSASVIGLEVPEEYRGTGIGKALQERVLQDYPSLMGQVSSKAAAVNAYKAGRRPLANPNATLEDVFRMIDEDSSVNLATPKNTGGRIAKGPGGWVDDVVKMAGKVISGEGEDAAKAGIRAYQGSPHNFAAERLVRFPEGRTEYIVGQPDVLPDVPQGAEVLQDFPLGRMRMDKIGTGEGAQAYGHGLYAAENEGVAKGYRDRLSNMDAPLAVWKRPSGEEIDTLDVPGGVILLRKDEVNVPFETLLDRAQGEFARASSVRNPQLREAQTKKAQEALDWLKSNEGVGLFSHPERGHMYEVRINADPNAFLDWDKPLSEQSEAVKNAFRSMDIADESVWPNITVNDAYEMLRVDSMGDDAFLRDQAYRLARRAEAGAGASRMLREAGIPGIKYLDAGSRGAGDGTRNYVVFDDKLISIIRKYGIAGASAMLGYNLMEQLDPKQALAASMADQDYQASRPQRSMGGNNSISGALNVARGMNRGR